MNTNTITFDIETEPLPAQYLDMIAPEFEAPSNYKDPEKIKANIAEQKTKWMDRAALTPLTGRVLAIGVKDVDGTFMMIDGEGSEARLLADWNAFVDRNHGKHFVGFNIFNFDIPFLIKRAWKHGVKPCVRAGAKLRYTDNWTDLREVWQCGDRTESISLDTLAKYLGVGSKSGSGKDFGKLWHEDREAARAYLENDLLLTEGVAERMGILV